MDLLGFSLTGPGGSRFYNGIGMDYFSIVEIKNGTVRNFPQSDIRAEDTVEMGNMVANLRVSDNGDTGVSLNSRRNRGYPELVIMINYPDAILGRSL